MSDKPDDIMSIVAPKSGPTYSDSAPKAKKEKREEKREEKRDNEREDRR